jgi:Zn-dependent oligopeptidase
LLDQDLVTRGVIPRFNDIQPEHVVPAVEALVGDFKKRLQEVRAT